MYICKVRCVFFLEKSRYLGIQNLNIRPRAMQSYTIVLILR